MIIHISHSAGSDNQDWFVIHPLVGQVRESIPGHPVTHDDEVDSFIRANRTVYELDTETMSVVRLPTRSSVR